jgi:hypothetical protein
MTITYLDIEQIELTAIGEAAADDLGIRIDELELSPELSSLFFA